MGSDDGRTRPPLLLAAPSARAILPPRRPPSRHIPPSPTTETVGARDRPETRNIFNPSVDFRAGGRCSTHPDSMPMVREALDNSPSLAQATAKLKEAQEEANARTGATKYPSVSANVSAEREQLDLATFGIPFPSPPPFNLLNGSVAVSIRVGFVRSQPAAGRGPECASCLRILAATGGAPHAGGKRGLCRYSAGAVALTNRSDKADARAPGAAARHRRTATPGWWSFGIR